MTAPSTVVPSSIRNRWRSCAPSRRPTPERRPATRSAWSAPAGTAGTNGQTCSTTARRVRVLVRPVVAAAATHRDAILTNSQDHQLQGDLALSILGDLVTEPGVYRDRLIALPPRPPVVDPDLSFV